MIADLQSEKHEQLRVAAVAEFEPELGPEEPFDSIARLVRKSLKFPLALISLVDDTRRIYKSSMSDGSRQSSRVGSFCSIVVDKGSPLVIEDTLANEMFRAVPFVSGPPHLRAYWGAPLTTRSGFNVGTLAVGDFVPRCCSESEVQVLVEFARLTIEFMEMKALATVDVLTGLSTRRNFESAAKEIFSRARQLDQPLSCVVLDADHFKFINDKFGHAVGDNVLSGIGRLFLLAHCRPGDCLGRIGGEEFAILLPATTQVEALALADRLREAIADDIRPGVPKCTASFGVAELAPTDRTFTDLLTRADHAMYSAKRAGRNRTVTAGYIDSRRDVA